MGTLEKCKCQHCDQNIEFESLNAGRNVNCPGCGMETILFAHVNKMNNPAPGLLKADNKSCTDKNDGKELRGRAEGIEGLAIFICALAGIALVLAILSFSIDGAGRNVGIFVAVIGGLLGAAGWLYIIAQIVHIRANTHKDLP